MRKRLKQIPGKLRGIPGFTRKRVTTKYAIWSSISVMASIGAVYAVAQLTSQQLFVAPFTASAVLVCGGTESAYAQPRNLVGGHLCGAITAVAIAALFGSGWYPAIFAVGVATLLMNLTDTTHPPAGATAFLGVMGNSGPLFILTPILAGSLILLSVALFTNNVVHHRRYPTHWF